MSSGVNISEARWPDDGATVEALFREYVASLAEDISFQDVEAEFPACRANTPGQAALC